MQKNSLRSKRFQSSYCAKVSYYAKVSAEAKKRLKGEGEGRRGSFVPLPLPRHSCFFCSCPSFLDEPREETLATQASRKMTRKPRSRMVEDQIDLRFHPITRVAYSYMILIVYRRYPITQKPLQAAENIFLKI